MAVPLYWIVKHLNKIKYLTLAVEGCLTNAAGSLAGSDLDMMSAVNNACCFAGIDWLEAIRMASVYPAKALGLEEQLGYIKPAYKANMIALDTHLNITHTWIDGVAICNEERASWR